MILRLPIQVLWVFPVFVLGYGIVNLKKTLFVFSQKKIKQHKYSIALLVLIGLCSASQCVIHLQAGKVIGDHVLYPYTRDAFWNTAVVNELVNHFPPEHPGFSGVLLKNNHYLYHIFLSTVIKITGVDTLDLYFRYGAYSASFLFGLGLYIVSTIFTKNKIFQSLGIFLGYFSGSFVYVFAFLVHRDMSWTNSFFMADQPFTEITNPYTVLGFSMFLFSIFFFYKSITSAKKNQIFWVTVLGIFIGSLYGFKAFGGIIVLPALFICSIISLLINRKYQLLVAFVIAVSIFLPILHYTTLLGNANLVFIPGWTLTQMITDSDRLYLPNLRQIEVYYSDIHNSLGLFKIRIIELALYIAGNFGIRLGGVLFIIYKIFNKQSKKSILYSISSVHAFVLISFAIAFIIPLLFNLSLNVYDIIQFTPYALIVLSLYTTKAIEVLGSFLKKKNLNAFNYLLIPIIIIFGCMSNIRFLTESIVHPYMAQIPVDDIKAAEYIQRNSSPSDVVLVYPRGFPDNTYFSPMYIGTFAKRRLYLGEESTIGRMFLNRKQRYEEIVDLFTYKQGGDFFTNNHIAYILTRNEVEFAEPDLFSKAKLVFKNSKTKVYQVNK